MSSASRSTSDGSQRADRDPQPARRGDPVERARRDRPAPLAQGRHRDRLVRRRNPDVDAGPAVRGHPAPVQRGQQVRPPPGVLDPGAWRPRRPPPGRATARRRAAAARSRPSPAPRRSRPSTRAMLASSPATTATRRSGPYGLETERMKAHVAPAPASGASGTSASSAAWSSSMTSRSGAAGEDRPQPGRPVRRDRAAGRVLGPGGHHDRGRRRRARARRRPSTVGPSSSTGTGTASRPSAATRSTRLAQPGSSTADPVARAQVGREQPFDRVERAGRDGDRPRTGTPSAANRCRAELDQLGPRPGLAVPDRRGQLPGDPVQRGVEHAAAGAWSGSPLARSTVPGRDHGRGAGSRPAGGAAPGCRCGRPSRPGRADAGSCTRWPRWPARRPARRRGRAPAAGWPRAAGRPPRTPGLDAGRNLGGARPGDLITYWHSLQIVLERRAERHDRLVYADRPDHPDPPARTRLVRAGHRERDHRRGVPLPPRLRGRRRTPRSCPRCTPGSATPSTCTARPGPGRCSPPAGRTACRSASRSPTSTAWCWPGRSSTTAPTTGRWSRTAAARLVTDDVEKLRALTAVVEKVAAGRSADTRPPIRSRAGPDRGAGGRR